jgi:hypothetical protein
MFVLFYTFFLKHIIQMEFEFQITFHSFCWQILNFIMFHALQSFSDKVLFLFKVFLFVFFWSGNLFGN